MNSFSSVDRSVTNRAARNSLGLRKKSVTIGQDSCMVEVLLQLAPAVNWLNEVEPIDASKIPKLHLDAVKQLEKLGLVFRRNSRTCALQRHRLIRMLKRLSRYATAEKEEQFLSAFARILEVGDSRKNRLSDTVVSATGIA